MTQTKTQTKHIMTPLCQMRRQFNVSLFRAMNVYPTPIIDVHYSFSSDHRPQRKHLDKVNNIYTKIKLVMSYFPTPDPNAPAAQARVCRSEGL